MNIKEIEERLHVLIILLNIDENDNVLTNLKSFIRDDVIKEVLKNFLYWDKNDKKTEERVNNFTKQLAKDKYNINL